MNGHCRFIETSQDGIDIDLVGLDFFFSPFLLTKDSETIPAVIEVSDGEFVTFGVLFDFF